MPGVEELLRTKKTELETLINDSKALRAQITAAGEAASGEDRTKLNKLIDQGLEVRKEVTRYENELSLTGELKVDDAVSRVMARNGGLWQPRKSWGQTVIDSDAFKTKSLSRENPVEVGNFNEYIGQVGRKAIYSQADAQGGYTIVTDREPEVLDIARMRPRSILDLVTHTTTNSDLVEYIVLASRTENAAVVAERTLTGGGEGDQVFGLKPESDRTFGNFTAAVKTIAAWVGISRQILNDNKQVRQLVDDELTYEVEKKLESTLITDILAWSGIQTRVHQTGTRAEADDKIADTLRRAITDLYLEFYAPDGIVLHPAQGETMELDKDDNGAYMKMYDSQTLRIWRVPVVETPAMTSGSALVANFKLGVKVWDREQTQILTGQPDDYFLRNAFAILAELRAAWAVTRPKAVEKVTGLV